jgi:hypothetical protein
MVEEYHEWHISVSKTDVLEVCKLQHFVVWTAKSPTNSIRSLTNTSAVTTPFILHVVTKACKISIKTGIRCTCYDKLEYKIKINYITLMCMYTHSLPHTTARVITVQHLRTIHCIILKLSSHTCWKLWIWKIWKQNGFWIRVFWDVMPWQWVNGSSVIIIEKGNRTD